MSGDTEVKTQKWTSGAMAAASDLIGAGNSKLYIRAESFKGWAEAVDIAEIISRETKDAEMADLLREIHGNSAMPADTFDKLEALLTTLEKI